MYSVHYFGAERKNYYKLLIIMELKLGTQRALTKLKYKQRLFKKEDDLDEQETTAPVIGSRLSN